MEKVQRTRLVTLLILGLVFGTGVVVGFAVDRTAGASPPAETASGTETPERDTRGREGGERTRRVPMWEQVGGLSQEQHASIDSIVDHHRAAMRSLQREFEAEYNPRYWAVIEETREAIKDVMSASQAETYDSLLTHFDSRRDRRTRERSDTTGR